MARLLPKSSCVIYSYAASSVIPKSNNEKRIIENFDCIFGMSEEDLNAIDNLVAENGERGVRNFNSLEYLGFDNYNEEFEEP